VEQAENALKVLYVNLLKINLFNAGVRQKEKFRKSIYDERQLDLKGRDYSETNQNSNNYGKIRL
jgi:hypothetical protein